MTANRLLPAALAVAAGCSWIVDPDKIKPDTPADAGAFCGQLRQAQAAKAQGCLGADPGWAAQISGQQLRFLLAENGSATAPVLFANVPGPPDCTQAAQGQARGLIAYDAAAAYDCITDVSSLSCADFYYYSIWGPSIFPRFSGDSTACNRAMVGRAAATSACHSDLECEPGAWCNLRQGCPGTCQFQTSDGQPCADARECYQGRRCLSPPTGGQATCQDLGIVAAGCSGGSEICDYDFYCPPVGAAAPTCQPRRAASNPCPTGMECARSLACTGPRQTPAAWVCQAPRPVGGACTAGNLECVTGAGCPGATGANATCQQWPGPGGSCGPTAAQEPVGCTGGFCDATPPIQCRATTPC